MKTCFVNYDHRAIVDLCPYEDGLIITRINVPELSRGKGIGSALLNEVLREADKTNTTLYLEILSSGPLSYDQLEAWYKRHGFKGNMLYIRKPNHHKINQWI